MNFATFEAQETDVWQAQNSNADLFSMDPSYFGKQGNAKGRYQVRRSSFAILPGLLGMKAVIIIILWRRNFVMWLKLEAIWILFLVLPLP